MGAMKFILTGMLLVSFVFTNAQKPETYLKPASDTLAKSLGIGIVSINYGSTDLFREVKFYITPNDTATFCAVYLDFEIIDSCSIEPFEWMVVPGRLMFRYIEEREDWYQIIMVERTNETAWVKKVKNTSLQLIEKFNWLDYLNGGSCVESVIKQPIRINPSEDADTIDFDSDCNKYEIIAIKEDWIKVLECYLCENPNAGKKAEWITNAVKKAGWIKWHEGNKIVVSKFYSE